MASSTNTVGIRIVTDSKGAIVGIKNVGDNLQKLGKTNGSKGISDVEKAGKNLKGTQSNLDGVRGKLAQVGTSLKSMVGAGLIIGGVSKAFNVLQSSIGDAVNRVDTLNNANRVFENMGFSADETKTTMDSLKKSIQGLPTPLDGAIKGVQLIASSTNDLGKSEQIFAALNNGILGFGGSAEMVDSAIVQLSQSFSNGKVDAQTWNSMINSGLGPALNALAKQMGKTTGELKDGLSSGAISVDEFQDSLIKLNKEGGGGLKSLEQIAKDSTSGIKTSMANIKTAVVRGLANVIGKFDELSKALTGKNIGQNLATVANVIDSVFERVVKAMDGVIPIIENLKNSFKGLDDIKKIGAFLWIENSIQWVTFYMKNLTGQLGDRVGEWVALFSGIANQLEPILTRISAIISGWSIVVSAVLSSAIPIAVDILKSVIQGLADFFIPIFDTLTKTLWSFSSSATEGILNEGVPALQQFGDWVRDNTPLIETLGKVLGAVILAFGLFKTITGIISVIQTVVGAFVLLKNTLIATYVVMMANPISLLIAAIAGLVAGVIYLWQTNEGFRDALINIWNTIVAVVQPIIQAFSDFFMGIWTAIKDWWDENSTGMLTTAQDTWNTISDTVSTVINAIKEVIEIVMNKVKAFWDKWGATITAVTTVVWEAIKAFFDFTLNNILGTFKLVFDQINNVIQLVMGVIKGIIETVMGAITGDWTRALNGIRGIVDSWGNFIRNTFNNIMNYAKNIVNNAIDAIKGFFSGIGNVDLWGAGKAVIDGFIDGLKATWEAGKEFISGIGDWIAEHKGPISYDKKLLIPAGNAIMDGLQKGLIHGFGAVQNTVGGIAGDIEGRLQTALTGDYALNTNYSGNVDTLSNNTNSAINRSLPTSPVVINIENVDSEERIQQLTRVISSTMEVQYQNTNQFE